MAEEKNIPDDIYGNKKKWENWIDNYINKEQILIPPKNKSRKYYCKNKANLKYYEKLIRSFDVDGLSWIRRLRLKDVMNFLCHFIEVDLKKVNGVDREEIIIQMRKVISDSNLKKTERDVRRLGRIIFSEKDMPDFFKNFEIKTDVSRQTARKDKLTYKEFDRFMKFFSKDTTIQAYLSLAFESLARPQEICYTTISDLELQENYAYITISGHGKEGIKKLLSIDSYPYLLKMYNQHPQREDAKAFLFLNECNDQLTPFAINKKLKRACRKLKIDKPITCYSLKRFGVTYRRLQGDDDVTIQKIAGWRSSKQLRTYDLSDQEDIFKMELAKRGLIKGEGVKQPKTKNCEYCGELVGFAESTCPKCTHIIDRNLIKDRIKKDEEMVSFIEGIRELKETNPEVFEVIKEIGRKRGIIS